MEKANLSFLSLEIPQEFCVERTLSNIKIATYLSYGIVLLNVLLLFNDYSRYLAGKWAEFPPMEYITYSHIGYLFTALSFLVWKIHFSENAKPKHRNFAIMGLINGMLIFCVTITIAAQHIHGQVTMYVLGVVVVAFLIVQSPKEMILTFVMMWLMTMIGLTFLGNPVFYSATSINLTSVVFVSSIISYYMFRVQMSSFQKSKLIAEQRLKLLASKTELEDKVLQRTQDLRVVNNDLKQAKTELNSLVYRSSHDLRGPMSSILGLVEVIKYENIPSSTQQYMGMIAQSVGKMDRVMQEINEIAANSQNKLEEEYIKMDTFLAEIIEEMAASSQISFNLQISEEVVVCSDKKRLHSIFHHIIRNVVDYSDPQKLEHICDISLSAINNKAMVEITDNGIGIPASYISRITEMFFRTEQGKGSGLGLYIVQKTLDLLKGQLEISSEEGKYTRVRLMIPLLCS